MKASKVRLLVFLIMITLCVVTTQPVKSQSFGIIYIRADGSVEGTDKIQRDGNIYTFTGNIYHSIVVERDNIVVDGEGYTLQGKGTGNGIDLSGRKNVTVKNLEINQFDTGIYINVGYHVPRNNTISGNIVTNNNKGIHILGAYPTYSQSNNRIYGNNITNNNEFGILIAGSSNNRIYGNNIANNGNGIRIEWGGGGGYGNRIYHNNFINNTAEVPGFWIVLIYEEWVSPQANVWDDGKEGNYWSDYEDRYPNAKELDSSGIWDTPYFINENNIDNFPLMAYWCPPTISILSPENKTYTVNYVPLTFVVSKKPLSWIGYSVDGQANVTISGNTTLTGLSDGMHSLIVYASDIAGNTGASETKCFTITQGFLGSTLPMEYGYAIVAVIVVAIAATAFLIYFRKIRKTPGKTEKLTPEAET